MARGRRCFDCCDEIGLCNCNCPVGWTGATCATVATDRNYFIDAQAPVCETYELVSRAHRLSASTGNATGGNGNRSPTVAQLPQMSAAGFDPFTAIPDLFWSPTSGDRLPFWQVDFGRVMSVSMVKVSGNHLQWVSAYNLWFLVQNTRNKLWYPVLTDQNSPTATIKAIPGARQGSIWYSVPYRLCPNIRTRALVFHPVTAMPTASGPFAMRFLVYGCPPHASCSTCCNHEDGCQCKCPLGYTTNYNTQSIPNPWDHCDQWNMMAIDCEDYALRSPGLPSGVYPIYPPGQDQIRVYCDMTSFGGGWTVIQNRIDNTQDFIKFWLDYKNGFGNLETNFWLGLEKIYKLTSTFNTYQLLIKLTTQDAETGVAYYSNFYLDNEALGYALHIDADSCGGTIGDSLIHHAGERFYTKDMDTHPSASTAFKCATNSYGGWWYKHAGTTTETCHDTNLNAMFSGTMPGTMATWATWRGYMEPMKTMRMMIRRSPLSFVLQPLQPQYPLPVDCEDILAANPSSGSGTYKIYPVGSADPVEVFCEMVAQGGGWTVIQRHYDSSVSFNRDSNDYTNGFGSPNGNYYLGNKWIQMLTALDTNLVYQLGVVLEDTTGEKRTANYRGFWLDAPTAGSGYKLRYVTYNPDSDIETPGGNGLSSSQGYSFQTSDAPYSGACAQHYRTTGWWYKTYSNATLQCSDANLNGAYGNNNFEGGMFWEPWKGRYESLKSATMMIKKIGAKPVDCEDLYDSNSAFYNTSGMYWIYPYGMQPFKVYCLFDRVLPSDPVTAWTVIHRRVPLNSDAGFESRSWPAYKSGFPTSFGINDDYWLGLENIHNMVRSTPYTARVRIYSDALKTQVHNYQYSDFYVASESEAYRLLVKPVDPTDSHDALTAHNLMTFSTLDNATDNSTTVADCRNKYSGGWWYNPASCDGKQTSQLTALFSLMFWNDATVTSTPTVIFGSEIMIRRKGNPWILNLPYTRTKQLCPNLNVIYHECQHTYKPTTGDSIRVMDPDTPGIYSGTDLVCKPYPEPMDCSYYQRIDNAATSRFFSTSRSDLYVPSTGTFTAYCDQETMGGGWTVIQRRLDDTQTFLQDIIAYDLSFGGASSNFWLGNNNIRGLTTTAKYELLVEMKTNLSYAFALYDLFYTTSGVNVLHLERSYQNCSTAGDSLWSSEDKPFISSVCGAWWFAQSSPCVDGDGNSSYPTSNLNALYGAQNPTAKGIYWWTFENGFSPNLMASSMKIRRVGTHGRYITAANFSCDAGTYYTSPTPVTTVQACQDLCTGYRPFNCLVAVYNRVSSCTLRSQQCGPGQGSINTDYDSYFRVDKCTHFSTSCGPAPTMVGTSQQIIRMPTEMSVNYTCRSGFTNTLFASDWTVLTCDAVHKQWIGQWLDCKTLCGDIPDMSKSNALLTPKTIVDGTTITIFYECQQDYELINGTLIRICAPPFGSWRGDNFFCNTTRCDTPTEPAHSWNNFTIPQAAELASLNRRWVVWNYTCDLGYVFLETMTKWRTIQCMENKEWLPRTPGTCIPFRCENPPIFENVFVSPSFANRTYYEYGAKIFYQCEYNMVMDPLKWDNNITISCVRNQTWGVINYAGKSQDWLPAACVGEQMRLTSTWCSLESLPGS